MRTLWEQQSKQPSSEGLGKEIYDATMPCFTYDFSMSADYYVKLAQWLHKSGQTAAVVDTAAIWTNALAH